MFSMFGCIVKVVAGKKFYKKLRSCGSGHIVAWWMRRNVAVLKDRLSTGRSIAKYRYVLYQQRVDGTSTLKGSSRVYLVVYNIEGPNLPSIIATIFDLR